MCHGLLCRVRCAVAEVFFALLLPVRSDIRSFVVKQEFIKVEDNSQNYWSRISGPPQNFCMMKNNLSRTSGARTCLIQLFWNANRQNFCMMRNNISRTSGTRTCFSYDQNTISRISGMRTFIRYDPNHRLQLSWKCTAFW